MDATVPPGGAHPLRRRAVMLVAAIAGVAAAGALAGFLVGRPPGLPGNVAMSAVGIDTEVAGGRVDHGSGIAIDDSGLVVTAYHVISGSLRVGVDIPGRGSAFTAAVLGIDPSDDVALLQVPGVRGLTAATLGDAARVAIGERITALGGPRASGDGAVQTQGVVTALRQTITASDPTGANLQTLSGLIQFTAASPSPEDGGPLIDAAGRVIGLDSAGGARVRQSGGEFAYAIPIDRVLAIVHDIQSGAPNPRVLRGHGVFVGVDVQDSTSPRGALVLGVEPGSPAQAAGITRGDVIVSFAGRAVTTAAGLGAAAQQHHPGDRVSVEWIGAAGARHGTTLSLVTGFAA